MQLIGLLMLAFGITAKASQQAIKDLFSSTEQFKQLGVDVSGIINANAIFMIVIGVIVLVIAVFGFVGACCMVRWMLVVVSDFSTCSANNRKTIITVKY